MRDVVPNRKPTRSDLLHVIGRLQNLIGSAKAAMHDRNPHREAQVQRALEDAHRLCVAASAFDDCEAIEPTGKGWGDASKDDSWKDKM